MSYFDIKNIYTSVDVEKKVSEENKGRRLIGVLFLLSILFTFLISIWIVFRWMKDSQYLSLSRLIITGERYYTYNDDICQLILALGSPMTLMIQDVNIIQRQIEQLPWIKKANIRKRWPGELIIHLVEYIPIAYWNDQHMIDMDGNFFNVPNDRGNREDLPKLYGPEGANDEVLRGFRKMKEILVKNNFTLKDAIMTPRHSWRLTLTNGIKLTLGRDDTIKRLSCFVELYPVLKNQAQTNGKQIHYVDLRYDSGAAVGWKFAFIEESNQK